MTVGPIWNTGGTETEIIVPVSVLGPERAGTEMGGDLFILLDCIFIKKINSKDHYRFKFVS